jgi:carbon monoxide dehydrogenase subunit G
MQLTNGFTVDAPIGQVWDVLIDVERTAPSIPGFQLTEIEGEEYRGLMRVKVGAVVMEYDGSVVFVERDDQQHRAVLRAQGKERRGPGRVSAEVASTLTEDGHQTAVHVVTDLDVVGRVAQFGRGILADVSNRLIAKFAVNLAATIEASRP